MDNPLKADLDHILAHTQGLWADIQGARIFITGGTGFIGCWLLESFAWANDKLGLNAKAVVLTRNPDTFARKAPHLAHHPAIGFHIGDVRTFSFPERPFSHVIHAATEASAKLNAENPLLMFDTIVEGTRRVLDFAVHAGVKKFLFTSSGAVYGRQPSEITRISEDYNGGPDPLDPKSAYGEGKRAAETLCCLYAQQYGLEPKIARCFAFIGPYLPLDVHFAIGNFIHDALRGGPIRIEGDGAPYRSYIYAADLAVWLWTILMRCESCRPYNVGSEQEVAIGDVAKVVAKAFCPGIEVQIAKKARLGGPTERYVPDTLRVRTSQGLQSWIPLSEAIQRTIQWYIGKGMLLPNDR